MKHSVPSPEVQVTCRLPVSWDTGKSLQLRLGCIWSDSRSLCFRNTWCLWKWRCWRGGSCCVGQPPTPDAASLHVLHMQTPWKSHGAGRGHPSNSDSWVEKGDSFAQVSRKEKPEFEFKQYDSGSGVWKLPLRALSGSSSVFKQLVTKNSGYTVGWLRRMKTILYDNTCLYIFYDFFCTVLELRVSETRWCSKPKTLKPKFLQISTLKSVF